MVWLIGTVSFGSSFFELPGWQSSTLGIRRYDDLPAAAKNYLARIEEAVGVSIDIISTGPDRAETIVLKDPFNP